MRVRLWEWDLCFSHGALSHGILSRVRESDLRLCGILTGTHTHAHTQMNPVPVSCSGFHSVFGSHFTTGFQHSNAIHKYSVITLIIHRPCSLSGTSLSLSLLLSHTHQDLHIFPFKCINIHNLTFEQTVPVTLLTLIAPSMTTFFLRSPLANYGGKMNGREN